MTRRALVVGAAGAVGEAAALALIARGWRVTAAIRSERADAVGRLTRAGAAIVRADIATHTQWAGPGFDAAVFATPLPLTLQALERADLGGAHVTAFSSNNVAADPDAETYRALAAAEQRLRARHPGAALVRPTLIYGDLRLVTMTRVLRFARRWPVIPLPGSGRARVQPVFHDDLGNAVAGLADTGAAGVFALGGPDIVSMRALFEAAVRAAGGRCLIAPVPAALLALAPQAGFTRAQAARAERDRVAITKTPLPPALAPRTPLEVGLSRLAAALFAPSGLGE